MLSKILNLKGVHYLATRFGSKRLRAAAFDERYRCGAWVFEDESADLADAVKRYLNGGDLLVLGCGGAAIVATLQTSDFQSVLGVDLSEEAIRLARRFSSSKVRFEIGDMSALELKVPYDVILFSESLYYISCGTAEQVLGMLRKNLKKTGVIIVTFAQPARYRDYIEMIRRNFTMLEDRKFAGSARHILVFN